MKVSNQRNRERGAYLVELAILLPLFLIILMSMIEIGLLFYNKQVVTNSSREGARYGIHHATEGEIISAVRNYCQDRLITFRTTPAVNAAVDGELGAFGTPLTVTVSYDYNFLVPDLVGLGTDFQLSAESMMRMERPLSTP